MSEDLGFVYFINTVKIEKGFHRRLHAHKAHREWFHRTREVEKVIRQALQRGIKEFPTFEELKPFETRVVPRNEELWVWCCPGCRQEHFYPLPPKHEFGAYESELDGFMWLKQCKPKKVVYGKHATHTTLKFLPEDWYLLKDDAIGYHLPVCVKFRNDNPRDWMCDCSERLRISTEDFKELLERNKNRPIIDFWDDAANACFFSAARDRREEGEKFS